MEIQIEPQWGTSSHQLEWLLPKRRETTSAGEEAEEPALSFTDGGNVATTENRVGTSSWTVNSTVNWYGHYGKQHGGSSKS